MPRMDGTGPMGAGTMTGRGCGPCAGGKSGGCVMGRGAGMGRGARMGGGAGMGRRMNNGQEFRMGAAMNANPVTDAREQLQQRRDFLKTQLDALDKTLQNE